MPLHVDRGGSSPFTSQLQEELRDWYTEKSRLEYRCDAYAKKLVEQRRRSELEEEDVRLEALQREGRSRIQERFHHQRMDALTRAECKAESEREARRKSLPKGDNSEAVKFVTSGFRRYEPTPQLTVEDILYGFDKLTIEACEAQEAGDGQGNSRVGVSSMAVKADSQHIPRAQPSQPSLPKAPTHFVGAQTMAEQPKSATIPGVATAQSSTPSLIFKPAAPTTAAPPNFPPATAAASTSAAASSIFNPTSLQPTSTSNASAQAFSFVTPKAGATASTTAITTTPPSFTFSPATNSTVGFTAPSISFQLPKLTSAQAQPTLPLDVTFDDSPTTLTRLGAWIKFYSDYFVQLEKDMAEYESDMAQKQMRQSIRKSITARINFATKKRSTDKELGKLVAFFIDLFEYRTVREGMDFDDHSPSSRSTFQLERGNTLQLKYAMWTMCTRFVEQIKWDQELISSVILTMGTICLRQTELYHIFNAVILHESTFMKLSGRAVLAKILSLLKAPPEASANWIAGEQSIFRLFYRVQFPLRARSDFLQKLRNQPEPPETQKRETGSSNVHDTEPVRMFLVETLALPKPVLISSAFIAGEVLDEACLKQQLLKNDPGLLSALPTLVTKTEAVAKYDWEPVLQAASAKLRQGASAETAAKVDVLLRSRHESLIHLLKRSIQRALGAQ